MISLLNCLGKVCKKVVTEMLAEWYEVNQVPHSVQMGYRSPKSTIDTMARVVSRVQEA